MTSYAIPTPGLSEKLFAKYHGTYRIIERTSPVNYLIEPVTPTLDLSRRGREIVPVERLKPHYDPLIVSSP